MDRRSFLALAAGSLSAGRVLPRAGRNLPGQKGLRLSVTWGMLGKRPVGESLALLTRLGYDAYEMFDWRDPKTLETFVTERKKYPLQCACLIANKGVTAPGCGLVNPREREEFVRQMNRRLCASRRAPGLLRESRTTRL